MVGSVSLVSCANGLCPVSWISGSKTTGTGPGRGVLEDADEPRGRRHNATRIAGTMTRVAALATCARRKRAGQPRGTKEECPTERMVTSVSRKATSLLPDLRRDPA